MSDSSLQRGERPLTCDEETPWLAMMYSVNTSQLRINSNTEQYDDTLKNSLRSTLKSLISPPALTKDKTCQFWLGPFHRFQVCPAIDMPDVTWDPTGWILKSNINKGRQSRTEETWRTLLNRKAKSCWNSSVFEKGKWTKLAYISYEDAEDAGFPVDGTPVQIS